MGTNSSSLAGALFGQTRRRVLGLLLGHPGSEYYVREIARMTDTPPGAVQRELQALEAAGILLRRGRGNQVFYRANRECPIFPELRGIVVKTFGLVDVLSDALAPLHGEITVAFVFGSLATGDSTSASDVDLFVVGASTFDELADALAGIEGTLGREVNPVVRSVNEFKKGVRERNHFVTAVLGQPKLFVIGGPDELGRLGAKSLAAGTRDKQAGDRSAAGHRRA